MTEMPQNKITQYGAELAMCLRREADHLEEARRAGERIEELTKMIIAEDAGTLYGMSAAETAVIRTADAPMPMRFDRLDGGSTFALNPIMDTVTSGAMSSIVPCPDMCAVEYRHVHTADGAVHPITFPEVPR